MLVHNDDEEDPYDKYADYDDDRPSNDRMKPKNDPLPPNNVENDIARDAANEAGGLDAEQREELHRRIGGQNLTYDEVVKEARDIRGGC